MIRECRTWPGVGSLLVALLAAGALGGCASSLGPAASAAPSPPASAQEGRAELSRLEQEIALGRQALGLTARLDKPSSGDQALGFRDKRARTEGASGEHAASRPAPLAPSAPPPPAAVPEAAAASPAHESSEIPVAEGDADACGVPPCRYTRAICGAATRICELARYLDDQDSRDRCGRARQDCEEARQATRGSCRGC